MASSDLQSNDVRTQLVAQTPGEQSFHQHEAATSPPLTPFSTYSFSSPEFRQAIRQLPTASGEHTAASLQLAMVESPNLSAAGTVIEPVIAAGQDTPHVPTAPAEEMEDTKRTMDPCTKQIVNAIPAPKDMPKALDSVKERDPELFKQIQGKVTDPRYTGELGDITVSTHDKKGRVNGCVFEQNVPYWESGPAAKALFDVNIILAAKGKKLEADPLNGAGRTLAQEEAIVWRNSGVHAKVGKSNHGFGKAEDFKPDPNPDARKQPWDDPFVNATLHAHGWRQGDSWGPLKNDMHHWSFVGAPVQPLMDILHPISTRQVSTTGLDD